MSAAVPLVLMNDDPFNVGTIVDQMDISIANGTDKEFPVVNKSIASVAGRIQAGNAQYIQASQQFTRLTSSVLLNGAPPNGTPVLIPGIIRFVIQAYDQSNIQGRPNNPNVGYSRFWIGDPLTISQNTYLAGYNQTGISVNFSDNDTDNGADLSWLQLGYAHPVFGNCPEFRSPTVSLHGAAGSAHVSYVIAAYNSTTLLSVSLTGTSLTSNATLNSTNYNVLSWEAVPNATTYKVYRLSTTGTAPTTLGLIGTTSSTTLNDTGLAGDAATVPTPTWKTSGTALIFDEIIAQDTTTASISVGATSIAVGNGAQFVLTHPTAAYIRLGDGTGNQEDLQVLGISGNTITIQPSSFSHPISEGVLQVAYSGWAKLVLPEDLGPLFLVDISTDLFYDIGIRA